MPKINTNLVILNETSGTSLSQSMYCSTKIKAADG